MQNNKISGVAVPLGALYTKNNPVIGEFPDLIPFAKFCKSAGFKIIQLLPVNDTGTQSSPYSGLSAYALHPIYIRLNLIAEFELALKNKTFKDEYDSFLKNNPYTLRYNYDNINNGKISLLQKIFEETQIAKTQKADAQLSLWIKNNPWISTYAVYKNLKWKYLQSSWKEWKKEDQYKTPEEIQKLWNKKENKKEHLFYAWCQKIASEQFSAAVDAVHKEGLFLKGDMPILMNEDSADTWAYPEFFNQNLKAGSPEDGDNPTGQNWGFPTYNWKNLKEADYSWWMGRLQTASVYYDYYRLDHILGFFRIWAIPASDCNALNGHTEPYAAIKIEDLYDLGFDNNRIRWLSEPHIPTGIIEDITWNHEAAHRILSLFCEKLEGEELWLFSRKLSGSREIRETSLKDLCTEEAEIRIKEKLIEFWSNRSLLQISKNKYVPLWTYEKSTSWQSLNETEKTKLSALFKELNAKNEKLWKKQASEIFTAIEDNKKIKMIPCGEDLGVGIACVPQTMKKYNIYGLRVVRWCREWEKQGQPFVPFANYEPLSVTTTSVHDSSTIRQWWEDEKSSVKAFIKQNLKAFELSEDDKNLDEKISLETEKKFTSKTAFILMKTASSSKSQLYINPLQDYLYMEEDYWLDCGEKERINIPGTVTPFNWTYRLPVEMSELIDNKRLISKIIETQR